MTGDQLKLNGKRTVLPLVGLMRTGTVGASGMQTLMSRETLEVETFPLVARMLHV